MNRTRKQLVATGTPHVRRQPVDNGVKLTTFIPLQFKKRGIQKVIIAPHGMEQPVTVHSPIPTLTPTHDPVLLKAIGRGFYWQHLLDTGGVANTAEIAEREGLHKVTVNEGLRLALLAPDIVKAAMEGTLPLTISLEALQRTMIPQDWRRQREAIAALAI